MCVRTDIACCRQGKKFHWTAQLVLRRGVKETFFCCFVAKTQQEIGRIRKFTPLQARKVTLGVAIGHKCLKIALNTQETQCVHIFN